MKELVAKFFEPLLQREAKGRVTADRDETLDGDGEDDAEGENNTDEDLTQAQWTTCKTAKTTICFREI
ncbi:hypothetical protein H920_09099 [Fukomys damarensis]|uniref:Uncharacterized protein n=1 Tax=Fukomys damarensis TaxID=885580 RepID=A0A091DEI1_FUKDA|nr:hypothetical protein H920_09099 [Fukomys damarensis]